MTEMTETVGEIGQGDDVRDYTDDDLEMEIRSYAMRYKKDALSVSEIVEYLHSDIDQTKSVLEKMKVVIGYNLKDSGQRKVFDSGANRDLSSGKGRFDLLPPATLRALAVHFEKGAVKYDARNWEKGIPVSRFVDSTMRHLLQFLDGHNDENHLIAALWNVMCAYETILRIQKGEMKAELYDLPKKITLPDPYADK